MNKFYLFLAALLVMNGNFLSSFLTFNVVFRVQVYKHRKKHNWVLRKCKNLAKILFVPSTGGK